MSEVRLLFVQDSSVCNIDTRQSSRTTASRWMLFIRRLLRSRSFPLRLNRFQVFAPLVVGFVGYGLAAVIAMLVQS
jgi:hypothetical protein